MAISSRFFSPSTFAQEAEGLPCFPWDRVGQCHRKDPKCPCFSGTLEQGQRAAWKRCYLVIDRLPPSLASLA